MGNTQREEEVVIEVSNEDVAKEVGYALLGRAGNIHEDPVEEGEEIALELRDKGQEIIEEYE